MRVTVGGLWFDVTPTGATILGGCLSFEIDGRCLAYYGSGSAERRLQRQGLVAEVYCPLGRDYGLCLTPIGRMVAVKLFEPDEPEPAA